MKHSRVLASTRCALLALALFGGAGGAVARAQDVGLAAAFPVGRSLASPTGETISPREA